MLKIDKKELFMLYLSNKTKLDHKNLIYNDIFIAQFCILESIIFISK